jgi:uncharacterized protein (TIGR02996 family)
MLKDDAFLDAIRAERDDDAPRLVYADWLEENGQAERAELIRVQCEQSRTQLPGDQDNRLGAVATRLIEKHCDEWLGLWPAVYVQRGFLDISCPLNAIWHLTPSHLAAPLLLDLTLSTEQPKRWDLIGLDRHPAMERVTRLSLGGSFDDHFADLLYILGVPYPKLDTLLLSFFPGATAILRTLERLPTLRHVHLTQRYWNNPPRDDEWEAVFRSAFLENVTDLNLADQSLGPTTAALLAQSPHLRRLARLQLGANRIGPAGAQALAASENLALVRELDLAGNRIRDPGLYALAASSRLANIERLRLGDNEISGIGLRALIDSPLPRLRELSLGKNFVGCGSITALAESTVARQLTHLELGDDLGDDAMFVLAGAENMEVLQKLDVAGSRITNRAMLRIADHARWPSLRRLRVASPRITEAGVLALMASPTGVGLRELELPMCRADAALVESLLTAAHLHHLRRLQITLDASPMVRNEMRRRFGPRLDC